eukprot:TRINITY_DN27637_c0_g1_i7.p1 TRINITY_DN27637_c0_g1~~TRINITY_DN27637_c0_g1_i7.p1  ORF type:complete len:301 (-),score=33.71 TRINITY_DN27637_c0_g1_i7:448-1350(-)
MMNFILFLQSLCYEFIIFTLEEYPTIFFSSPYSNTPVKLLKQLHKKSAMLPDEFQKGVAISVWQNSPDSASNWGKFCRGKKMGCIPNVFDRSDPSCQSDFWNNYKTDLQNTQALGCNAFRFSFEWSRIEPKQGEIDQAAIVRYHEMIDYMKELGIEPNATLHHFTHPAWFDKLGGFEKEENIQLFVNYSVMMFEEFNSKVKLWCTFNEPTVFSFCGFVVGIHSPGHMLKLKRCGKVKFRLILDMLCMQRVCTNLLSYMVSWVVRCTSQKLGLRIERIPLENSGYNPTHNRFGTLSMMGMR